MTISEHAEEFAGHPVRDFESGESLIDPAGTAYRLILDYDAAERGVSFESLWNEFLRDPASGQVVAAGHR